MLPNGKTFESLTESMRSFNEGTPDVVDVHYLSWVTPYEPGPGHVSAPFLVCF